MTARTEPKRASVPLYDVGGFGEGSEGVRADITDLVGSSKRVLDLNPAAGMSRAIAGRGCEVVGICGDSEAAEQFSESCERVIVGDVETLAFEGKLGEESFDVIVAAGVIDRMRDPLGTLRYLRRSLRPDGHFVISVPVAPGEGVKLAVLFSEHEGRPWGLGGHAHLRFFTGRTFERLLDHAELATVELRRYPMSLDVSNVRLDQAAATSAALDELEGDTDPYGYFQYVVKAEPMRGAELEEVQQLLEEEAGARVGHGETVQRLAETEGKMQQFKAATEVLYGEIEDLRAANLRLQVRLDQILASPPLRLYSKVRGMPGLRSMSRRREAAFDSSLEQRSGDDS